MDNKFILSCETTVDLPYAYVSGRDIPVLFYSYEINGTVYTDDMFRDPEALPHFYKLLEEGGLPSTTQLNQIQYEEFFDELLQKGDVLHIAFGTGMTGSYNNAVAAAKLMREKYPDRKLSVIDSLCSCGGYGMFMDILADMRDAGASFDELETWALENRLKIHHQFFSTDLKYFRRGGRVSGPVAMIGSILNICPIMHLDDKGKIIAYDKVRGKKNAIRRTVDVMVNHAEGGADYDGKCFLNHAHCPEDAAETVALVEEKFPKLKGKIVVNEIGTIIASHTGPGTVSLYFIGDPRTADFK